MGEPGAEAECAATEGALAMRDLATASPAEAPPPPGRTLALAPPPPPPADVQRDCLLSPDKARADES